MNYLIFDIFPLLKQGVLIHFHDIFYPFEMPYGWVKQGRYWNEVYLLRAFLEHNEAYSILFFNHMFRFFASAEYRDYLCLSENDDLGGGSIWLVKNPLD